MEILPLPNLVPFPSSSQKGLITLPQDTYNYRKRWRDERDELFLVDKSLLLHEKIVSDLFFSKEQQ